MSIVNMAKRTNRPSVINMSYAKARTMLHEYTENNETYLRSIVRNHIPNSENELACADRQYLIHMARTIKGVAKRVNDYDKQLLAKNNDILDKIKSLPQIADSTERELLDERICLRLEGCKIPNGCLLSNAYIGAKNLLR